MTIRTALTFLAASCATLAVAADEQAVPASAGEYPLANPAKGDPEKQALACKEGPVSGFGRYLGSYTFRDFQIRPDFSDWDEGQGGLWDFHCLGEGIAVQDIWQPRAGGFGLTLRMVDPETGKWDVVFTGEGSQKMSRLRAEQMEDGSIEMHYIQPAFDPLRRITFTPPDETGFDWTMAISSDSGESWTDVYRMRADRR